MSTLEVARVGRPHGVRGMLKIVLHWQQSTSLLETKEVALRFADGAVKRFAVEHTQRAGKTLLMKFAGVDDRDAAAALTGASIELERSELPALEPGEAYLVDLVGAQVFAPDGLVGEVISITVNPSVDSLVIRCPDGSSVELALLPAFVAAIDSAARRVELTNRDGLIESASAVRPPRAEQ